MNKKEKEIRLKELEKMIESPDFWKDVEEAQKHIHQYNCLKESLAKKEAFEAVIHINSGAGGEDAEDFCKMLAVMYTKYAEDKKFDIFEVEKHTTPKGGYKNITLEISNKKAYSLLKNETGVHRLVRISPFNSKKQRHTSFALVDVTPKIPPISEVDIPEEDIEIDFTNSGGPGGQNVNKRETAVRIKHKPSKIIVRVEKERSQAQNKETALEILRGKLFCLMQKERVEKLQKLSFDKSTTIDWGNQIRSYVLHPYKLVKDLRVDYQESDPDEVFDGKLDGFIEALKKI